MRKNSGNILLIILVGVAVAAASVGGYFWWSSKTPTPVKPVETKPINKTGNWKTYSDSTLGFGFKYPAELNERIVDKYTRLSSSDPNDMGQISLTVIPEHLNPVNIHGSYGLIGLERLKKLQIDGRESYFYNDGDAGCGGPTYRIPLTQDKHLSLSFTDCQRPTITPFINQILSTFKFL